jgi:hypothetical protein
MDEEKTICDEKDVDTCHNHSVDRTSRLRWVVIFISAVVLIVINESTCTFRKLDTTTGIKTIHGRILRKPAQELPTFDGYGNIEDGYRPGVDLAVFWHVPKCGGSTIIAIMGQCYKMVMANQVGVQHGHAHDEVSKNHILNNLKASRIDC